MQDRENYIHIDYYGCVDYTNIWPRSRWAEAESYNLSNKIITIYKKRQGGTFLCASLLAKHALQLVNTTAKSQD